MSVTRIEHEHSHEWVRNNPALAVRLIALDMVNDLREGMSLADIDREREGFTIIIMERAL